MKWATFIDRNWVGLWISGQQVTASSAIVPDPLHAPNRPIITQRLKQWCPQCFIIICEGRHNQPLSFKYRYLCICLIHMPSDLFKVCVWVFDAGLFVLPCVVRIGCIWDIDEKRRGQCVAFSNLKPLSVALGFQSVLSPAYKMVVWNFLCRLCWIGSGGSLILLKMPGSEPWKFQRYYLPALYFSV